MIMIVTFGYGSALRSQFYVYGPLGDDLVVFL